MENALRMSLNQLLKSGGGKPAASPATPVSKAPPPVGGATAIAPKAFNTPVRGQIATTPAAPSTGTPSWKAQTVQGHGQGMAQSVQQPQAALAQIQPSQTQGVGVRGPSINAAQTGPSGQSAAKVKPCLSANKGARVHAPGASVTFAPRCSEESAVADLPMDYVDEENDEDADPETLEGSQDALPAADEPPSTTVETPAGSDGSALTTEGYEEDDAGEEEGPTKRVRREKSPGAPAPRQPAAPKHATAPKAAKSSTAGTTAGGASGTTGAVKRGRPAGSTKASAPAKREGSSASTPPGTNAPAAGRAVTDYAAFGHSVAAQLLPQLLEVARQYGVSLEGGLGQGMPAPMARPVSGPALDTKKKAKTKEQVALENHVHALRVANMPSQAFQCLADKWCVDIVGDMRLSVEDIADAESRGEPVVVTQPAEPMLAVFKAAMSHGIRPAGIASLKCIRSDELEENGTTKKVSYTANTPEGTEVVYVGPKRGFQRLEPSEFGITPAERMLAAAAFDAGYTVATYSEYQP